MNGRGSESSSIAQVRSPLGIEGPQKDKNVKSELGDKTRGHRQHQQSQQSEDEGKFFYVKRKEKNEKYFVKI